MQVGKMTVLIMMSLFGIVACTQRVSSTSDTAADEAALRAADETFTRAIWTGDLETAVALYAEDAVLMPADEPQVKGRDAIRKYFAADIASHKPGEGLVILESTQGVSGNLGWSSGRGKYTAPDGTTSTGKFMSVSRKVNGKWLYIRDTWDDDAPTPASNPPEPPTK